MKVTRLGPTQPLLSATGVLGGSVGPGEQVPTSNGSNGVAWGSNIATAWANGSNQILGPHINFASGSNIIFAVSSNTLTIHGQAGGGSAAIDYGETGDITTLSFSDTAAAGSLDEVARADHRHGMPADPGGGSGGDPFDEKPYIWTPASSAHATDDEFNDATSMSGPTNGLDAKWTKRNLGTASWLKLSDSVAPGAAFFDIPTGQAASQGIYQTVPAGDWTYGARFSQHYASDRQYWGIFCLNSSGTGVLAVMDSGADGASGVRAISTWGDGGAGTFFSVEAWRGDVNSLNRSPGLAVTVSLRKASGVYHMGFSYSDKLLPGNYQEVSYTPTSFTAAFIGFGRLGGTGVSKIVLDFFRKVA